MIIMIGANPKPLLHLSLMLLVLFSSSTQSLRFELQSGHTKCISEDIKSNSMTVGKYLIVNPNEGQPLPDSVRVTVRVFSWTPLPKNYIFWGPLVNRIVFSGWMVIVCFFLLGDFVLREQLSLRGSRSVGAVCVRGSGGWRLHDLFLGFGSDSRDNVDCGFWLENGCRGQGLV